MNIIIDKNNKYWIASLNGLIEYDGSTIKTHHMPGYQKGLLGSDNLQKILAENDSTLWLCHRNGIAIFNTYTKKYELIKISGTSPADDYNFIYSFKDSEGTLFFVSSEFKIMSYDKKNKLIKKQHHLCPDSVGFIFKISELKNRDYLILTQKGFYVYGRKKGNFLNPNELPAGYRWINNEAFKSGVNDVIKIKEDFYISAFNREENKYVVYRYHEKSGALNRLPVNSNIGRLFMKDSFGRLWIFGYGDIAELYDPSTNTLITQNNNEKAAKETEYTICYKVFEDHENNIWMCTNSGLLSFNLYQNEFKTISSSIPSNIYGAVEQINPHTLWFGTVYNGIYEFNIPSGTFRNYNFLKETGIREFNDIWQLYRDKKGASVWLIHPKGMLSRYNIKEKTFQHFRDTVFEQQFMSVAEDTDGNIYFMTENGKLIRYNNDDGSFNTVLKLNQLKGLSEIPEVNDLVFTDPHTLIIGTSGKGLLEINLQQKSSRKISAGIPDSVSAGSNVINIMRKFEGDEHIYAGTTNGILSYHPSSKRITNFSYREGFNLGFVYDITKDSKGNLIFIGSNELYLLDWKTGNIIDLSEKTNIFKSTCTGVFYNKSNAKLYVLSEESIYEITLNHQATNPGFKPVFYSVETFGKTIAVMDKTEIFLDKNSSSFRIHFGASTYKYRDDLEFLYNFNNEGWQSIASRELSFSNLTGGDYVLKIRAVFKGDRTIFSEKSLTIHLAKKFHQTVWFYLAIAMFTIAVFYTIYRIRLNRLLSIERVRVELSRDLHDDMGSTLSTINILSSMALTKIDNDINTTKDYLRKTSAYCMKMMDSMDDIVWSLNPANDKMENIIYRMREFACTILEPKNIRFNFLTDEKVNELALQMAMRRDFFLIFKEALNNAAKYSKCTEITIEIKITAGLLILKISDNGIGMEKNILSDGNGLINMRKRAALLKGQISIESEINAGTVITLSIDMKHV